MEQQISVRPVRPVKVKKGRSGPDYSGWTKQKRDFPFNFRPKFPDCFCVMESSTYSFPNDLPWFS